MLIPPVHEGRVPPPGTPTPCWNTTVLCAGLRFTVLTRSEGGPARSQHALLRGRPQRRSDYLHLFVSSSQVDLLGQIRWHFQLFPTVATLSKEKQVKLKSSKDIHKHFSVLNNSVLKSCANDIYASAIYTKPAYKCQYSPRETVTLCFEYVLLMFTVCFRKTLPNSTNLWLLKLDFQVSDFTFSQVSDAYNCTCKLCAWVICVSLFTLEISG